jgi:hypothetical protein
MQKKTKHVKFGRRPLRRRPIPRELIGTDIELLNNYKRWNAIIDHLPPEIRKAIRSVDVSFNVSDLPNLLQLYGEKQLLEIIALAEVNAKRIAERALKNVTLSSTKHPETIQTESGPHPDRLRPKRR